MALSDLATDILDRFGWRTDGDKEHKQDHDTIHGHLRGEADDVVRFNIYTVDNTVETEIAEQDVPVRIEYGGAETVAVNGGVTVVDDGIRYDGESSRVVSIDLTAALQSVGNNQRYLITIRQNDVELDQLRARARIGSGGDVETVSMVGLVEVEPGDVIGTWVQNETSDGNLVLVDGSFVMDG